MPVCTPSGFRPEPPKPDDLIEWPADFGTRFTVFVDTEEEFDWAAPLAREGHTLASVIAIPGAHRRFADFAVPLTYMVDYPVATDDRACDILRRVIEDGVSAIGTQLHAWVNPPLVEPLTPANSYVGNLPVAIETAKLDILTAAIEAAFGRRPVAYRAGRYGIGPATLALLAARGYRLDSSIRARYRYTADGGPDFSAIGNAAFRCGPGGAIIELPLTTMFTGRLRRDGPRMYDMLGRLPKARGVLARLGLVSRVAFTPEDMPLAEVLEAIAIAMGEGVRVLNFAFHSPSLAPGHTPYVRDAADLARFHDWWDAVLGDLDRRGVRPISLATLIAAAG